MTDSPGLTPDHDAVRRLLAQARHDGPTPPEVVARLESTLAELQAELQAERVDATDTAPVVDLAARRRRFIGAGVLAAAAVVVAGVALGQVIPQGGSDSGGDGGATSALEDRESLDSQSGGAGGGDAAAESTSPEALSGKAGAAQVPEVALDAGLDEVLTSLRSQSRRAATFTYDDRVACRVGDVGRGRQLLVQVDGQPGLVVFRAADGVGQEADIYVCGDPEPVRTLTIPAP